MSTPAGRLTGVIPVLATPLTAEDRVDVGTLEREVAWLVDTGVRWLALGYGSEIHCLAPHQVEVLQRTAATARGTVGLVGNVESTHDPARTLARIEQAAALGADVVLLRPHPCQGAGSAAVAEALAGLAAAAAIPLVIQDAPQHTGVELSAGDLARLAAAPGVAALKVEPPEAVAKIARVRALLEPGAAPIVAGRGAVELEREVAAGAEATMPGAGLVPELARLFALAREGNALQATRVWVRLAPLMLLGERGFATFVQAQKTLLVRRGLFADDRISTALGPWDAGLADEVDRVLVAGGPAL